MAKIKICRVCSGGYEPKAAFAKNHPGFCSDFCRNKNVEREEINKKRRELRSQNKTLYRAATKFRKVKFSTNKFTLSREWLELRFEALVKYGTICMCCGARPPKVVLHVDHIKPIPTSIFRH